MPDPMPVDEKPAEKPLPSVWTRARRKRPEQESLSQSQIVAAAMELLDADGLEALSMRKLGARLGAGATSLYWYVATKDELIELVLDEAYRDVTIPEIDEPAQWRAAATEAAYAMREVGLRHPWIAALLGGFGLSYLGPNLMRVNDRALALFLAAGFDLLEADHAAAALFATVNGLAASEAAWTTTVSRSGRSERELVAQLMPAATAAIQEYPHLRALYAELQEVPVSSTPDAKVRYTIDRMLDGLEARLDLKTS